MKKYTITIQSANLHRLLIKAEGTVIGMKPTDNDPHKVTVTLDCNAQQLYEIGFAMGAPDNSYR